MTHRTSLRRMLRRIPTFRTMTSQSLDRVIEQMVFKEYQQGDILWRTGSQLDFLGVIQEGEIILERRYHGAVVRSVRLVAGDYVLPRQSIDGNIQSVFLARAATKVRLGILPAHQIERIRPAHLKTSGNVSAAARRNYFVWWWSATIILILALTWHDLSRVVSGILFIESVTQFQAENDHQEALTLLSYAKNLDQDAAYAYNQEGYLWLRQDYPQLAESALTKALAIEKSNSPALNNLATTYLTKEMPQDAVKLQRMAVQSNPNNSIIRYNLGMTLVAQNNNAEALREFREASYIDQNWSLPYIQQGLILLKMQNYHEAEKAGLEAIHLDATQSSAFLITAIALYEQGRYGDALIFIENALTIDPNNQVIVFYKALITNELGDSATALQILTQLLETSPDAHQSARIRAEIEKIERTSSRALPDGQ